MQNLKIVSWNIVGTRPLMQSNYRLVMPMATGTGSKVTSTRSKAREEPFEEAKKQLYTSEDGTYFFHPGLAFYRAMMDTCTGRVIGGVAASSLLPKSVLPVDDEFVLCDPKTLNGKPKPLPSDGWQMDSRRVVNEKAGALIVHRPKWPVWGGVISFEVDEDFIPEKHIWSLTDVLNIAGRYGIGTGRMQQNPKTKKWGGLAIGKFTAELRA